MSDADDPFSKLVGLEDGKDGLFFDRISEGELFSSLHLSYLVTSDKCEVCIEEKTKLTKIELIPNKDKHLAIRGENKTSIFICYKGIDIKNVKDILMGVTVGSEKGFDGYVHKECNDKAKEVGLNEIYEYAKSNNKRIVFCGHNLGGSTAILATINVLLSDYYKEEEIEINCITFGSPLCISRKVVDKCKERGFEKHFVNFVNEGDIVPASTNKGSYCILYIIYIYLK